LAGLCTPRDPYGQRDTLLQDPWACMLTWFPSQDFIQAVASVPQPLAQMSMFGEVVPLKTERSKRTR
jgi:hypothetical protein